MKSRYFRSLLMTLSVVVCCLSTLSLPVSAASADLYLYFWSESYGLDGNAGQFESTAEADIYTIASVDVPGQGFNFGVHNASWSLIYGWADGGTVSALGVDYPMATANSCSGWLDLPAGKYSVTFNAAALTIRFDEVSVDPDPDPDPDPEQKDAAFLIGGDLSMATYIEDWGAKFYYKDGTEGDLFDILESYGVNFARLRLYHAPGTAVKNGSTIYRTPIMTTKHPSGYPYAGTEDILNLAKRAKDHKMQICLTIYLSDYWSGATEQYIPAAWANVNTLELLGDSVYNYVYAIMTRMADQGTLPEYVSVGNETNYGILYQDLNKNYVSYGGHTTRNGISNAVYLFNKAYDAIKEVAPDAQVIIHHSYGDQGKIGVCRSFFQQLKNNGCKFDIVGGSYYPHWATDHGATDCKPTGMLEWAADMKTYIGKPVMLMEVGYSWNPYKCPERNGGSWAGQLGLNGCYNEATEAGQESFIRELHEALDEDANIVGYMYWDPIFVDQKVNGSWIKTCWAEKYSGSGTTWWEDGNVISNTTLFDFTGKPLSALHREMHSRKPVDEPTGFGLADERVSGLGVMKIIREGQLLIMRDGRIYNLTGSEIR